MIDKWLSFSEHTAKESAEYIRRFYLRKSVGSPPSNIMLHLELLKQQGFIEFKDFLSKEKCSLLINAIERIIIENDDRCKHWQDSDGSDYRLWGVEKLDTIFKEPFSGKIINDIQKYYMGVNHSDNLTLAARLSYVPKNRGSGGGWHRDSPHTSQLKAIIYLSDVTLQHGPFEYIRNTHRTYFGIGSLRKLTFKPNQYRFTDEDVDYFFRKPRRKTFTASAGTLIIADTKGIHRGKPIFKGQRYALTLYFLTKKEREKLETNI